MKFTIISLLSSLVLSFNLAAEITLPAAQAKAQQRQSTITRLYFEQAFKVGFPVEDTILEKVRLEKKGPIEGKASTVVESELLKPLVDGDPRVQAHLLPLDGDLVVEVLVQIDATKVDGGVRVWVERPDSSRESLKMRPQRKASRTSRGGYFRVGDGAKLMVATSKPYEVDVRLETRLTSKRAEYRNPSERRNRVLVLDPALDLPSVMCNEEALQLVEDARNLRPQANFDQALARWQEQTKELESCRLKRADQMKVEMGVTELSDADMARIEPILKHICDPGEKPDGPRTVELSLSEATEMVVDGTTYTVKAKVKAKSGLIVRQQENGRNWQDFVRAPGHTGRLRCFVDQKLGDEQVTLPVVRWDAGMWRFLRSPYEQLSGDLDRDLLPNWLDPDANGDGALDLAQRLGIEMPKFESTLHYEYLELQ